MFSVIVCKEKKAEKGRGREGGKKEGREERRKIKETFYFLPILNFRSYFIKLE